MFGILLQWWSMLLILYIMWNMQQTNKQVIGNENFGFRQKNIKLYWRARK